MAPFAAAAAAVLVSFPALTHCYKAQAGEQASIVIDASGELSKEVCCCKNLGSDGRRSCKKEDSWQCNANNHKEVVDPGAGECDDTLFSLPESTVGHLATSNMVCCKTPIGDTGKFTYGMKEEVYCGSANVVPLPDGKPGHCAAVFIDGKGEATGGQEGCCKIAKGSVEKDAFVSNNVGCTVQLFEQLASNMEFAGLTATWSASECPDVVHVQTVSGSGEPEPLEAVKTCCFVEEEGNKVFWTSKDPISELGCKMRFYALQWRSLGLVEPPSWPCLA